ncbi:MAG: TlpA disulfide reductase family protein [Microbacterium sp.]|uniref:TlpA family protein disulfide reductase n=1 Tax=Microbacterium sp. TaxID=51671 RepID=UPI0039E2F2FB
MRARGLKAASLVLVAGLVTGLAACAQDPLAAEYREGSNKGFVAGEFRVVDVPEAERGEPIVFEGTTEAGKRVSQADYAGDVLVVNFWYAACGPCRAEADQLEAVHQEYADQGVSFLGVNIYDQPETAAAFAKTYSVTYPSLIAIDDPQLTLAFADSAPLTAVPVTLVLDRKGRVAARIISEVEEASILSTLVRETLAESS